MDDERLRHRTDRLYGLGRCRGLFSPVCGLSLFFANVTFGLTASDDHSTDVAALLGANRFYEQGIFGQGATAAIVEGGLVWNGDSSTQHVTHYYAHPDTWRHDLGDTRDLWDRHATWSGSLLGGRGPSPERTGMAPLVDLRSGATATRWVGTAYTSSWGQTATTVDAPYRHFTETEPVDVINGSWGFTDRSASHSVTVGIDALAYEHPQTVIFGAAGNSGFSSNSVVSPAIGMNTFSVGGLDYAEGAYDVRWSSSGRGLSDYYDPVNGFISSVRASVDLLAPSENLSALRYGGATGGNNDTLSGSLAVATRDSNGLFGTSFSTPIASGAAALMYSLSRDQMAANEESRDARVVKAVLLNSAEKLEGWSAEETIEAGVWTTRQGLDAAQGAGRLDLDRAFRQYAPSSTTQTGILGGDPPTGFLPGTGWDLHSVQLGESLFYQFSLATDVVASIRGTLVWYRERREVDGSVEDLKQANLDLLLWLDLDGGAGDRLVAQSVSEYNTTEHLEVEVSEAGTYFLEVRYTDDSFKRLGSLNDESFAVAWDLVAVPEPAGYALIAGLFVGCLGMRRRR